MSNEIMIFSSARQIIKEKRYKIISDRMIDVGTNNVILQIKSGRSILNCSCQNHSRFVNENPICSHKLVFLILKFNEKLYQEIDNSIIQVNKYKSLNLSMNNLLCLDILESIKKAK